MKTSTSYFTGAAAVVCLLVGTTSVDAFTSSPLTPSRTTTTTSIVKRLILAASADDDEDVNNDSSSSSTTTTTTAFAPPPAFSSSKQHLYGLDMHLNELSSSSSSNNNNNVVGSVTLNANGEIEEDKDNNNANDEEAEAEALPLPDTYVTCGKCKCLFAITEDDLGTRGKGCRVKCSVCSNSWFQSRDRLLSIPSDTHSMLPAQQSDIDRIGRNLQRNYPPDYQGVGKLYVGNLDFDTTPNDLMEFFEGNNDNDDSSNNNNSEVCDVSLITGPDGKSRGFAFVTFYDESGGKAGLDLNGVDFRGRELTIREPNN